jgi:hypothetical protein
MTIVGFRPKEDPDTMGYDGAAISMKKVAVIRFTRELAKKVFEHAEASVKKGGSDGTTSG